MKRRKKRMCDEMERNIEDYDIEDILAKSREELIEAVKEYKKLDPKSEEAIEFIACCPRAINELIVTIDDCSSYGRISADILTEKISVDEGLKRIKEVYLNDIIEVKKYYEYRVKHMQEVIDKLKEEDK
jgi:hypothetical protein